MTPIADTGLLVGFLDAADQYHDWAVARFNELKVALTTCEAVVAEAEFLAAGSGPAIMQMVRRGTLRVAPLLPMEADSIEALLRRYQKMQFADACVVRLSELLRDPVVYTTDKRDFAIYRRNRNQPIETVTP